MLQRFYCRKIFRNSHYKKFPGARGKAQYANKVKCFTLQSAQSTSDPLGSRLMLGLKDPKDDSCCDYEPRAVVTKQKKVKPDFSQIENIENVISASKRNAYQRANKLIPPDRNFNSQPNNILLQVQNLKRKEEDVKDENSVTVFDPPEQNEESSKALMESIGSWINDLFSASNIKSLEQENDKTEFKKESVLQEDTEYFKSITAIKEQFRKKLKNETTVHVSSSEKPFEFNFDKVLDYRKNRKKTKLLPSSSSPQWLQELNDLGKQMVETPEALDRRFNSNSTTAELIIRTKQSERHSEPATLKIGLDLDNSTKERKKAKNKNRYELGDFDDFTFPSPAEVSKRILLNVNNQGKRVQFLKNAHLGVQDTQHYNQGKKKAYQSSARCYTTNANQAENSFSKPLIRLSHFCSTDPACVKGANEILSRTPLDLKKSQTRKPSKKAASESARDLISFIKVKSPKSLTSIQSESVKNDVKTSSDDLVKYLMKKIKSNSRPQKPKKKGSVTTSQSLSSPKSRFLQSATNTLVMRVMAKNENQLPNKSGFRASSETKLFPVKELVAKYPESSIRYDVSRAIHSSKSSRCSYLSEDEKIVNDTFLLDRNSYRNAKPSFEYLLKRDETKRSDKYHKRQEIKNMLNKFDVYEETKLKSKEQKKKPLQNIFEESDNIDFQKEEQNARFQKQHELFKTNLKMSPQNPDLASNFTSEETRKKNLIESLDTNLLPAELIIVDPNTASQNPQEKIEFAIPEQNQIIELTTTSSPPKELDEKIMDSLVHDEKVANIKPENKHLEKPIQSKEKLLRNKPANSLKEIDPQNHFNLMKDHHSEIPNQKDNSKTYETILCPAVPRPTIQPESSAFNRSYSTNILNEINQTATPNTIPLNFQFKKPAIYLSDLRKETERDEKESKKKKKVKTPKITGSHEASIENACGFEKVIKKPGPNCEKEE